MCHVSLALQRVYGCSQKKEDWRMGRLERMEIAWPLYADDLVVCSELEKDLRMVVGRFAEVRAEKV